MLYEDRLLLDVSRRLLSEEKFYRFCRKHDQYRIERQADGCIIVMEPCGFYAGTQNSKLVTSLVNWNEKNSNGEVADSSTG